MFTRRVVPILLGFVVLLLLVSGIPKIGKHPAASKGQSVGAVVWVPKVMSRVAVNCSNLSSTHAASLLLTLGHAKNPELSTVEETIAPAASLELGLPDLVPPSLLVDRKPWILSLHSRAAASLLDCSAAYWFKSSGQQAVMTIHLADASSKELVIYDPGRFGAAAKLQGNIYLYSLEARSNAVLEVFNAQGERIEAAGRVIKNLRAGRKIAFELPAKVRLYQLKSRGDSRFLFFAKVDSGRNSWIVPATALLPGGSRAGAANISKASRRELLELYRNGQVQTDTPIKHAAGDDLAAASSQTSSATPTQAASTAAAPIVSMALTEASSGQPSDCFGRVDSLDRYEICTYADLRQIARPENLAKDYSLANDIDMLGLDFSPVGDRAQPFTGTFDGNGYVISNLRIDKTADSTPYYAGLFGYISGATIKNLGLESVYVFGKSIVGALVGYNDHGTVERCSSSGAVSALSGHVGGLVGFHYYGLISKSYSTAEVLGGSFVGGVAGRTSFGTIENCYYAGPEVSGSSYVGGITAFDINGKGTVRNCLALSKRTAGKPKAGGLVAKGVGARVSVSNSYYDNSISMNCRRSCSDPEYGRTTIDLKDPSWSGYSNWDFVNVWVIHTDGYPELKSSSVCPNGDTPDPYGETITQFCSGGQPPFRYPGSEPAPPLHPFRPPPFELPPLFPPVTLPRLPAPDPEPPSDPVPVPPPPSDPGPAPLPPALPPGDGDGDSQTYLGCVDLNGEPVFYQECEPETPRCKTTEAGTRRQDQCSAAQQVGRCDLIEGPETPVPVGTQCENRPGGGCYSLSIAVRELTQQQCTEAACKYYRWESDSTRNCHIKQWGWKCEVTAEDSTRSLACEEDRNDPEVEGQDGGYFMPDDACYNTETEECGDGSCNFLKTEDKYEACKAVPPAELHIPTGAQCAEVDTPTFDFDTQKNPGLPSGAGRPPCMETATVYDTIGSEITITFDDP